MIAYVVIRICIKVINGKHTWQSEQRIWLGCDADCNACVLWLFVDLGLPVVYFVLFRDRQIALDAALGIKELDLGPAFNEAVGDL